MKIILSGYGVMGKVVESLCLEKGYEIVGVFSKLDLTNCPYPVFQDPLKLPQADVIIDFSHPNNVTPLLKHAEQHQLPIVVATTGARESLQQLMDYASQYVPIFFSANMSYGIHVLTELLKFVTPLLNDFDIELIERHHNKKIDAPSGTAIKLLEAIQSVKSSVYPIYDRSQIEKARDSQEIGMSVIRGGTIVGDHEIIFAGNDEVIEISHRAQSKNIFANGAIRAAEKLVHQPVGFYTFQSF